MTCQTSDQEPVSALVFAVSNQFYQVYSSLSIIVACTANSLPQYIRVVRINCVKLLHSTMYQNVKISLFCYKCLFISPSFNTLCTYAHLSCFFIHLPPDPVSRKSVKSAHSIRNRYSSQWTLTKCQASTPARTLTSDWRTVGSQHGITVTESDSYSASLSQDTGWRMGEMTLTAINMHI